MNIANYWEKGWPKLIAAQFHFYSSYFRPMAGLFYLPIYERFGLNPLPYRIVILGILAANALLAYYAAKLLSRSPLVAALAAIFTSYHGRMFIVYYNTSHIYDVLCFFFWFSAFVWYLRIRVRGSYLNLWQTLILLVLYVCALNSKEMAVTLPVILVAYECVSAGAVSTWPQRRYGPLAVLSVVTLVYVVGKNLGSDALSKMDGYRAVYTVGRFLDNNAHYAREILYHDHDFTKPGMVAIWLILGWLAFRRPRPYLRWALVLTILGAAPIGFIPARGGGWLNIPLFGYALFAAAIIADAARWLSRERWFARLPCGAVRLVLTCAVVIWYGALMHDLQQEKLGDWVRSQNPTWSAIQNMERIRPEIRPGARILFLNDPVTDWEMYFIARLVLRDRNAIITLQEQESEPLTPEEIERYHHVLKFDENNVLHRIR
jgi:hypothetical protein